MDESEQYATLIEIVSTKIASRVTANRLTDYLTGDLVRHHADKDLFAAFRRKLAPEDDLGIVLARLGEDHRRCTSMIKEISRVFTHTPAAGEVQLFPSQCGLLQVYARDLHIPYRGL